MVDVGKSVGFDFGILKEVSRVNKSQIDYAVKLVTGFSTNKSIKGKKIAILGLAFKPECDDCRSSQAIALAAQLARAGAVVYGADPAAEWGMSDASLRVCVQQRRNPRYFCQEMYLKRSVMHFAAL